MHDQSAQSIARVDRARRDLVRPNRHRQIAQVSVAAWDVPGEPVPFAHARAQTYVDFPTGTSWGRPWGTTWLRIDGTVPAQWPAAASVELIIELGFIGERIGAQCEGLVFTDDGQVVKGIEPYSSYVKVTERPGEEFRRYVEAASNPDVPRGWTFTPTPLGDPQTAGSDPLYRFDGARLALVDDAVTAMDRDLAVLRGLVDTLPGHAPRRARILRALEEAVDALDPDDVPGTAEDARRVLAPALEARSAADVHRVVAVGHAHIDSAWLWPVRETKRKIARTFANVLALMDDYPEFVFAASSAQQYQWLKESYPELFERVRARVREGRFVPVGGMWVESDTNMPGGEATVRQFVAGKAFFEREFGVDPGEVWLPDSFGYSAALPQIVTGSGCRYFLTQKTSWNDTNRMPHHSFLWEGIDGTRVFTHFPPVDTYASDLSAAELARAEQHNAERGASDLSLVPFGYGDGGGGPTREMMETARRKADLDGSPTVTMGTPAHFFGTAESELATPAVWSGELYLEFHRGTYTSQARTKLGNRRCEHLLREAELWATTATVRTGADYPYAELECAWHAVLLQQFHDILPGSSIAWVHQEAERNYAAVEEALEEIIAASLDRLSSGGSSTMRANASPFAVDGVPALGAATADGFEYNARADGDRFVLDSGRLSARFDADGHLVSLIEVATGREAVAPGSVANEFQLFRDSPNRWDAWDIDLAYRRNRIDAVRTKSVRIDGNALVIERSVNASEMHQRITLEAGGAALVLETTVDWHEQNKLLKLAFPFDVHANTAASEIQFGHIRRPTHVNTSWDVARFETIAHRWVHVDEPGFGVTLCNDRVYGHDFTRTTRPAGGTTTTVRDSLLRAPRFPDPSADQGRHVFHHSVRIGSVLDGVAEGYRLNLGVREFTGGPVDPLVECDTEGAVIESVKLAEDRSGDVVVRLYEARGGRARGRLRPHFATAAVVRTDLRERPLPEQPHDALSLELRPFEIVTVRLSRH
jgi:alpha-mannosidase